jgi:hypothetical protein
LAKALTTRFLDFWLLGGASLLMWLVMIALGRLGATSPSISNSASDGHDVALSLLVNARTSSSHPVRLCRGR